MQVDEYCINTQTRGASLLFLLKLSIKPLKLHRCFLTSPSANIWHSWDTQPLLTIKTTAS